MFGGVEQEAEHRRRQLCAPNASRLKNRRLARRAKLFERLLDRLIEGRDKRGRGIRREVWT